MTSRHRTRRAHWLAPIAGLALAAASHAQGRTSYLNFEAPIVRPMTVVEVDGHPYVFVCNTPDNSIEVYDTEEQLFGLPLVLRIPTGLEPVSITHAEVGGENRFFTANWLGDSVTSVRVASTGVPAAPLSYDWIYTVPVGDEPMDLVVVGPHMFVTLGQSLAPHDGTSAPARASVVWLDSATGNPTSIGNGSRRVIMDTGWVLNPDSEDDFPTASHMIMKQARTIELIPGTSAIAVLATQGGGTAGFDFDVWWRDFANLGNGDPHVISDLGTTNFNMTFSDGGNMWAVSTDAQFDNSGGTGVLSALPTGFAKTMLTRVDFSTVLSSGGLTIPQTTRDLNEEPFGIAVDPSSDSLSHATDVLVYEPTASTEIVFVTGFNSDRIGVVTNTAADGDDWVVSAFDVNDADTTGSELWGPRSIAVKYGTTSSPNDRIYVLNSLANSISIVDPRFDGTTVDPIVTVTFPLQNDPVPDYIREGQQFMYATVGTNGSDPALGHGFNSCASCHIDGRSDQLAWTLTPEANIPIPSPFSTFEITTSLNLTTFPNVKGALVTQSLQGLVNSEMGGSGFHFASNAPYHWRGDKPTVQDFNEAFENLLGGERLPAADIAALESFVNSVHYPPNPGQPVERTYSGSLGDPDLETDGDGARRGLKLFHIQPTPEVADLFGGRSCSQCHSLPVGSNNRMTTALRLDLDGVSGDEDMILETAALRGMRQKEATLEFAPDVGVTASSDLQSGDFGMARHGGTGRSIVEFHDLVAAQNPGSEAALTDINAYIREFDSGVAPMVGRSIGVLAPNLIPQAEVNEMEDQVREANVGLAVRYRGEDGTLRGFWYRVLGTTGEYVDVDDPAGPTFDLNGLQGLMDADDPGTEDEVMEFIATPLGSERRVASPTGINEPAYSAASPPTPSNVLLIGTSPNTANADVPTLLKNWDPDQTGGLEFDWDPVDSSIEIPRSLETTLIMQRALNSAGVQVRHDAPRRLRVTGDNLFEGCGIRLQVKARGSVLVPPPFSPAGNFDSLVLPLYKTGDQDGGRDVWETAVEFDPLTLYTLLLGGPRAPGVAEAQAGDETAVFDPANWNAVKVWARNQGGSFVLQNGTTSTQPGFQPLLY